METKTCALIQLFTNEKNSGQSAILKKTIY